MKHLVSFKDKMNENILYVDDTFVQDVDWDQTINISKLWNDYENGVIDIKTYNTQLAEKLAENLKSVNKFKSIISELKKAENYEDSLKIWNNLYDAADKNLVELK
jgi:hypothetical protein